jgi:ADP-heptose:LPS heptosyltransferase
VALAARGPARPDRVLVLRALGLGDLLVAVPALRGLRRHRPGARLVLAAPEPLAPLAALTGAVDEVLPATGPDRLGWSGPPPALAVNLHGAGPQSTRTLRALDPAELWAYAHPEVPEVTGPAWVAGEHEARRWCRLVGAYGAAADPADLRLAVPCRRSPAPGAVVVHPGAAYPSRRWPADRFAAVAAALRASGHRVVVTGSAAERELAAEVAARAGLPERDVLAGRTDVLSLAALVAAARLVVCGDTGVGHLATGYAVLSVLLFGPTPPTEWGPPPGADRHAVLWKGSGPGEKFADRPDPALLAVEVPEVLEAVTMVLDAGGGPCRDSVAATRPGRG